MKLTTGAINVFLLPGGLCGVCCDFKIDWSLFWSSTVSYVSWTLVYIGSSLSLWNSFLYGVSGCLAPRTCSLSGLPWETARQVLFHLFHLIFLNFWVLRRFHLLMSVLHICREGDISRSLIYDLQPFCNVSISVRFRVLLRKPLLFANLYFLYNVLVAFWCATWRLTT